MKAKRYTFKVQARKDGGAEAFMIVFNYVDEKNFDWLNLGGWGNTRTSVETTMNRCCQGHRQAVRRTENAGEEQHERAHHQQKNDSSPTPREGEQKPDMPADIRSL